MEEISKLLLDYEGKNYREIVQVMDWINASIQQIEAYINNILNDNTNIQNDNLVINHDINWKLRMLNKVISLLLRLQYGEIKNEMAEVLCNEDRLNKLNENINATKQKQIRLEIITMQIQLISAISNHNIGGYNFYNTDFNALQKQYVERFEKIGNSCCIFNLLQSNVNVNKISDWSHLVQLQHLLNFNNGALKSSLEYNQLHTCLILYAYLDSCYSFMSSLNKHSLNDVINHCITTVTTIANSCNLLLKHVNTVILCWLIDCDNEDLLILAVDLMVNNYVLKNTASRFSMEETLLPYNTTITHFSLLNCLIANQRYSQALIYSNKLIKMNPQISSYNNCLILLKALLFNDSWHHSLLLLNQMSSMKLCKNNTDVQYDLYSYLFSYLINNNKVDELLSLPYTKLEFTFLEKYLKTMALGKSSTNDVDINIRLLSCDILISLYVLHNLIQLAINLNQDQLDFLKESKVDLNQYGNVLRLRNSLLQCYIKTLPPDLDYENTPLINLVGFISDRIKLKPTSDGETKAIFIPDQTHLSTTTISPLSKEKVKEKQSSQFSFFSPSTTKQPVQHMIQQPKLVKSSIMSNKRILSSRKTPIPMKRANLRKEFLSPPANVSMQSPSKLLMMMSDDAQMQDGVDQNTPLSGPPPQSELQLQHRSSQYKGLVIRSSSEL